jgi:hypothetical protein
MLYEEFLAGTKARESSATYEQYQTLEKIYMDCEAVTKEDVYRMWRQTYGKQAKLDRERLLNNIKAMSEYRDHDGPATPEETHIRRQLFQTAQSLTELNEFRGGWNASITTPDGVTYHMDRYNVVNFHPWYRLWIEFEGQRYGTALVYSNGDSRIHATPENLPAIA